MSCGAELLWPSSVGMSYVPELSKDELCMDDISRDEMCVANLSRDELCEAELTSFGWALLAELSKE